MFPIYIGKESNRLEEVEQGTIHDWEEIRSEYYDPGADPWRSVVVPVLKTMDHSQIARLAEITARHVARFRNEKQIPSPELGQRLAHIAADEARKRIGGEAPIDDLQACAAYLRRFCIK